MVNCKFFYSLDCTWSKSLNEISTRGPFISDVESRKRPRREERDNTHKHQLVTNICQEIDNGFKSETFSGYLQGETHHYLIRPRPDWTHHQGAQQPSLEDILRHAEEKLTRRQRLTMSLTLASSFIQLQNTPWVTSFWQKSSIVFPEQTSGTNTVKFDEPFITHKFRECVTAATGTSLPAQGLSSFGVTLLEICFGTVIEDHPRRPKLPSGTETADIKAAFDAMAAKYWLEDVADEAGPEYANGIAWCLSKHMTLLDKADWRQEMFQQVVRPLCEITKPWNSHTNEVIKERSIA